MDFIFLKRCIHSIPSLKIFFRGIITKFDYDMMLNETGFWIYFIPGRGSTIGHFVCIIEKENNLYAFDSYGRPPRELGLPNMRHNSTKVQPINSCACAAFVLFFAFHSIKMEESRVISKHFVRDLKKNEELVLQWLHHFITLPMDLRICLE